MGGEARDRLYRQKPSQITLSAFVGTFSPRQTAAMNSLRKEPGCIIFVVTGGRWLLGGKEGLDESLEGQVERRNYKVATVVMTVEEEEEGFVRPGRSWY